MRVSCVIFDMDGTILNTLDDIVDSVNYMLTRLNYPNRTIDEVRSFVGNGIQKLVERVLPNGYTKAQLDEAVGIFKSYYATHNDIKTAPYDGIINAIDNLKLNGKRLAVVSNKYDAGVKQLATNLFGKAFDVAIGESDSVRPKPSSDGINLALQILNEKVSNAIYVGDSEVDYETARNSGLEFIGVSWGFRTREFLESIGVKYIIDNPTELIAKIESIL